MNLSLMILWCAAGLLIGQADPAPPPTKTAEAEKTAKIAKTAKTSEADAATPASMSLDDLRTQLDALLAPTGVPIEQFEESPNRQLVDLAAKSGVLSRNAADPQTKLEANQLEMRAYNALAQSAQQADRPGEASLRVTQLRSAAQQTRQLQFDDAEAAGAFWLLQADLIDLNRNTPDLAQRQAGAIERLEAFLDSPEAPPAMKTDVKLALLRLYEQAGRSEDAAALLLDLRRTLSSQDPRREQLHDARRVLDMLGEPIAVDVNTTRQQDWSLADQRGRPVLIHVYADAAPTSVALFEPIGQLQQTLGEEGVSVLSLAVNSSTADRDDNAWPIAEVNDEDAVLRTLGVRSLPWLVVVDADGKVAAVGQTGAVLDRVPRPATDTAEPAEPAEPAPTEPTQEGP